VNLRTVCALSAGCSIVLSAAAWAGAPVGWRTDGTGKYPQADPPIKWSADENVFWKTPLPAASNATPIVVGDKVFVCSEPTDLICLSLADGRILWRKANDYRDAFTPAQTARAEADARRAKAVVAEVRALRTQYKAAAAALAKAAKDPAARAKVIDLKKRTAERTKALQGLRAFEPPKRHSVTGTTSPTPVSDGKFVYVHTGEGAVACYDLDGRRQWIKWVEKPLHDWAGHCNSPLLVGGRLIVHVVDVVALDARTGKELWRTPSKWHDVFGSPIHVRVGGTDLYVDPNGDILRVSDGRRLAEAVCPLEFPAPVADAGVLYFIRHGGKALKLPATVGETLVCRTLWQTAVKKDRYYASPVVHDGLIYAVTRECVFSVIDAADGKVVYTRTLDLGGPRPDQIYSSVALAGKYVYVSHKNGTTAVLAAGRQYRRMATNKLEPFRSCPVFLGRRMLIRGQKHLYCIAK